MQTYARPWLQDFPFYFSHRMKAVNIMHLPFCMQEMIENTHAMENTFFYRTVIDKADILFKSISQIQEKFEFQ